MSASSRSRAGSPSSSSPSSSAARRNAWPQPDALGRASAATGARPPPVHSNEPLTPASRGPHFTPKQQSHVTGVVMSVIGSAAATILALGVFFLLFVGFTRALFKGV